MGGRQGTDYWSIMLQFADDPFRANKIGFDGIECIVCDNTLTLITSDYDRILIAPIDFVKSITSVDRLTVNNFGELIEEIED